MWSQTWTDDRSNTDVLDAKQHKIHYILLVCFFFFLNILKISFVLLFSALRIWCNCMSPRNDWSKLYIYMCEGSYIVHISTTSHISACKYSHNYLLVPKISLWLFPSCYRCCLIWTLSWPVGLEHISKTHLNSCLFFLELVRDFRIWNF